MKDIPDNIPKLGETVKHRTNGWIGIVHAVYPSQIKGKKDKWYLDVAVDGTKMTYCTIADNWKTIQKEHID